MLLLITFKLFGCLSSLFVIPSYICPKIIIFEDVLVNSKNIQIFSRLYPCYLFVEDSSSSTNKAIVGTLQP